jgi:UDP-N-acetylglucosamine 2-epimerase (non-hydrolysing)
MSDVFFQELGIPAPTHHLGAGGGSHAEQTARIMVGFEKICLQERPGIVLVVGDVNSTLACSIVARKLGISVAHVEAGLRSGDLRMPEEINRIVTDSISDLFFVTEPSGVENLLREGKSERQIHFVGHVMIDNLFYQLGQLDTLDTSAFPTTQLKNGLDRYGVVTLHRPSNVDEPATLTRIIDALGAIAERLPLIFAVHPRTRANLQKFGIAIPRGFHLTGPLPYMEFLNLWRHSAMVLTDSGGIQEETTALGVPCITLRDNTERPITISQGTNVLVGTDPAAIRAAAAAVLEKKRVARATRPALWDGRASERIVRVLVETSRSSSIQRS